MKNLFKRRAVSQSRTVSVALVETLESRQLLSGNALRVVTYNIEADIDGYTSARPGLTTVLQGISDYTINGQANRIDVLSLQETTSNTQTVQPIVDSLNAIYGAGTYATSTFQASVSGGFTASGNGPNAVIYDTTTVSLLESKGLPGSLGSSSGMYRQVARYLFQPVGGSVDSRFYVYVSHMKASTGASNEALRAGEAAIIRADADALPANARIIYSGDLNSSKSSEGMFTKLMAAGHAKAYDPLKPTGVVGDLAVGVPTLSYGPTGLYYRDDYLMSTYNVLTDPTGFQYVANSYQVFGNNGSLDYGDRVLDSSNTALAGMSNRSQILQALTTASDHLPVVADYSFPLIDATGKVSGTVFNDADGNGSRGANEAGLGNRSVYVDLNNNAKQDAGEPGATTDSTGKYTIAGVTSGSDRIIRQVLPTGWTQTTPTNNWGIHVAVTAGATTTAKNFGARTTAVARTTQRINVGGPKYTFTSGAIFDADRGYTGGSTSSTVLAVGQTSNDPLYYTYRWGKTFNYDIAAGDGAYKLALYFIDPTSTAAGQRKFDVTVEGVKVLSAYDIYAQVGNKNAATKTFNVTVTGGQLNIAFKALAGNAIVSAIEIVPV